MILLLRAIKSINNDCSHPAIIRRPQILIILPLVNHKPFINNDIAPASNKPFINNDIAPIHQ